MIQKYREEQRVQRVKIAIVGSGFAGIGMGIKLIDNGEGDFVILERSNQPGGTWRDNTYPGAACDVPSHLYSFSGRLNPKWSRSFSPQSEIQQYLVDCVREGGLLEKILFENKLEFAQWLPDDKCWELTTTKSIFLAKYLILATGALSEPSIPDIAGIERYQGKIFHSANWDHEYNLTDKRVAVIGTGASAIQFVPQIQPQVRQLHLFQRTPPWIMPRHDRRITFFERHLFKDFPIAQRLVRSLIYWARELYVFGFVFDLRIMKLGEKIALRHLRTQVRNPVLRDKLTPSYTLGCKRILISNDYYPSLENENVEVVTDSISELTDNTIITRKGEEFEVDAIIFGTGFHVTDLPISDSIVGRDGVSLREYWKEGMHAYKGTCVPGFPNLFLLVGPNTGLGHNSQVFMIECQIEYVAQALDLLKGTLKNCSTGSAPQEFSTCTPGYVIEVNLDAESKWNYQVQEMLKGTVWTSGGCNSWYLDESGRNTTLWPRFTWQFKLETRKFDIDNYSLVS